MITPSLSVSKLQSVFIFILDAGLPLTNLTLIEFTAEVVIIQGSFILVEFAGYKDPKFIVPAVLLVTVTSPFGSAIV